MLDLRKRIVSPGISSSPQAGGSFTAEEIAAGEAAVAAARSRAPVSGLEASALPDVQLAEQQLALMVLHNRVLALEWAGS